MTRARSRLPTGKSSPRCHVVWRPCPDRERETTLVLCAKYLFQHVGPHPLLSLLPALVHLPAHEAEQHVQLQLQLQLQLLRREAIDAGSGSELVVPSARR